MRSDAPPITPNDCRGSNQVVHVVQIFDFGDAELNPGPLNIQRSAFAALQEAKQLAQKFPAVIAWSVVREGPPVLLFEHGPVPAGFLDVGAIKERATGGTLC
jgi:hypothetical protein